MCFWAWSSALTINLDSKRNLKKYYVSKKVGLQNAIEPSRIFVAVNFFIMLIIAHDQVTKS